MNVAVKLADGFAVTFRDITAVQRSQQALQQANQQLADQITEQEQRHTEMILLSEISDFLQACLSVSEACTVLGNLIPPLFPHCTGGIFLTQIARNRVEDVMTWGGDLHSALDFHPSECWGLRRGRAHVCDDLRSGVRCQHVLADTPIAATLCVPMIAQGETLGLFYLSTTMPAALSEAKRQLARTVAKQASMAIANLQLRETLQTQSIRDALTGLFNRRYLEESLSQAIAYAHRRQSSLGVIMIDVDHFKRFNDTYGHDAGDYVLQQVGSLLKSSVRESDIACRYGGEEMVLVLPGLSLEHACIKAEAIRSAIAHLALKHNGRPLDNLTASFGVAVYPEHGTIASDLLQVADAALYQAKAAGRNQVVAAGRS